jgi:hypothetical protein
MANPQPFTPGATITIAATNSTATTSLPAGGGTVFMVQNAGTSATFVNFGSSTVTALVATSTPILGGQTLFFKLPPVTSVASITGATAVTLYITNGEGGTS